MSFKVVTYRAVEALRVEVLVEGLHPFVSGFNGEVAGKAHSLVQLAPVCKHNTNEV